ncbi:hypothetical protein [Rhizobium sp. 1399]|uniref:hypothetical protein n=1 Tax=Rhizobium sp. 1399 TaxID=2817758 RepID=UPI0028593C23|nr:hypothetical protein [Rhizobium sp. 1399]MDR6667095.1 hypothetical protein [Rhizobium sp. 1399]
MSVYFYTSSAKALLADFRKRIHQQEEKGKITTWIEDSDGDFTHKSEAWGGKAWFRPVVSVDRLAFNIIKRKDVNISVPVYGYYHGHLIETFLNHFDDQFTAGSATAKATADDNIR